MTETQADILTKLAGAFAAVRCAGARCTRSTRTTCH